jgi:hypothetical protein
VRLILTALRAVLTAAVEDKLIDSNPASKIGKFNKRERGEIAAFSTQYPQLQEEAAKMYRELDYYPLFFTALRYYMGHFGTSKKVTTTDANRTQTPDENSDVEFAEGTQAKEGEEVIWLPPRDSNPDMLIQRQATFASSLVPQCSLTFTES